MRVSDYFFVASIQINEDDLEMTEPRTIVLFRYPQEDHEDIPFMENAEYFCLPEGAKIEHREIERRNAYIYTFCFTQSDGSQSYGTTLVFYEKLLLHGNEMYNKYNQELFIPKALCILSQRPFFSLHSAFLKQLFKSAVPKYDGNFDFLDTVSERTTAPQPRTRRSSVAPLVRQMSSTLDNVFTDTPPEINILYYLDHLPILQPGIELHIPLYSQMETIIMPPASCLPYCDVLCMQALLNSLSRANIRKIVCALLKDYKVLMHSQSKYQLTLCSTALISLLKPLRYTLTYIPLLPSQLLDYIESPTPYLIGICSSTFTLPQCVTDDLEAIIVHIDFDCLTVPKDYVIDDMPHPYAQSFNTEMPPLINVLQTDRPSSSLARFVLFHLTVGPGPLGIKLYSQARPLRPDVNENVACIQSSDSSGLNGSVSKLCSSCSLMRSDPAIVEVNGVSVIGLSLKKVTMLISCSSRPLTLTLQVGTLTDQVPSSAAQPTAPMLLSRGGRGRGGLGVASEVMDEETMNSAESGLFDNRVENNMKALMEYYEDYRLYYFTSLCLIFRYYKQCIIYNNPSKVFDVEKFASMAPERVQPFMREIANKQLFEGLVTKTMALDGLRKNEKGEPIDFSKHPEWDELSEEVHDTLQLIDVFQQCINQILDAEIEQKRLGLVDKNSWKKSTRPTHRKTDSQTDSCPSSSHSPSHSFSHASPQKLALSSPTVPAHAMTPLATVPSASEKELEGSIEDITLDESIDELHAASSSSSALVSQSSRNKPSSSSSSHSIPTSPLLSPVDPDQPDPIAEAVVRIRNDKLPNKWSLRKITLRDFSTDGLPEDYVARLLSRSPTAFPTLQSDMFGEPMFRYSI